MGNKIVNKEERWHLNADNITKLLSQQGMKQKDLSTLNGYWNDRSSAYINELLHHRTVPTDAVEGLQSFFNSLLNCRCRFQYFVIENGDNYLTDEERNKAITNNKG